MWKARAFNMYQRYPLWNYRHFNLIALEFNLMLYLHGIHLPTYLPTYLQPYIQTYMMSKNELCWILTCCPISKGYLYELDVEQYNHTNGRKEGNILFNDALNTFYLRLYGVGHMVKDHSDSERGNPLPPHGLLFSINSKGSFICIIPQIG